MRGRQKISLGLLGLLVASLGVLAILYWQRPRPPWDAMDSAYRSIQEARSMGADRYCPDRLKAAEDSLRFAKSDVNAEAYRAYFLRDYGRAQNAAIHSLQAAVAAESAAVAVAAAQRSESDGLMRQARGQVEALRESLAHVPGDGLYRRALFRYDVTLAEAAHHFAAGYYRKAGDLARTVSESALRLKLQVEDSVRSYNASRKLWRKWAEETIRWSRQNQAPAIIVQKLDHTLDFYVAGRLEASYPADLGSRWMGDKLLRGDNMTPEGTYRITKKLGPGQTKYHKALLLDYPNDEDRRRFAAAKRRGEIPRGAHIGGLIEIHGHGGRGEDWTQGCVAIENSDMDRLFARVRVGTPVTIVGSCGEPE